MNRAGKSRHPRFLGQAREPTTPSPNRRRSGEIRGQLQVLRFPRFRVLDGVSSPSLSASFSEIASKTEKQNHLVFKSLIIYLRKLSLCIRLGNLCLNHFILHCLNKISKLSTVLVAVKLKIKKPRKLYKYS